jgi:hypothetical protein
MKSIWSHIAAFADIFNDMSVLVYDDDGKAKGYKPVPVTIGPKEKIIAALIADNGISVYSPDNYLPRISVTWNGMNRNADRQRGNHEKRRLFVEYDDVDGDGSEETQVRMDMQTVPYDINFEVSLWTKHMDDLAQILENILPFFNPDAPVSLYERGTGQERIVKVTLDSVTPNFVTDLAETDRRVLQVNLGVTMEMNFYRPEIPPGKPIKRVTVRMGADTTSVWLTKAKTISTADGDTLSAVALPCLSGGHFNDYDSRTWTVIQAFDGDTKDYMADTYHNQMRTTYTTSAEYDPTPPNPNLDPTDDTYYGLYGDTQFIMGYDGYYYNIDGVDWNNQAFVPTGQDPTFTWTIETSAWAVDDCGREGILYEGGEGSYNYDISGSYYVQNEGECDTINDPCGGEDE